MANLQEIINTDIAIIGGGIAGTSIARELSKYDISITVIEQKHGVGLEGTSTNHSLVCQGGDSLTFRPGTLHAELNIKSIPLWPKLSEELNFKFRRIGGLWLIRDNSDYKKFQKMVSRAFKSTLDPKSPLLIPEGSFSPLKFVDKKELKNLEPEISDNFLGALYDPNLATVDPPEVAKAYAENAKANGVDFLFNTKIKSIKREENKFELHTDNALIKSNIVINASGIEADRVAEIVKARDFSYVPLKGTLVEFDEELGKLINHETTILPRGSPHLQVVSPTVDNKLKAGIHLVMSFRSDKEVKDYAVNHAINVAKTLYPALRFENHITKSFVGFMAMTNPDTGWHDFVIANHEFVPNWINIVLGPAGVSASPMLGKKVVEILTKSGLILKEKSNYNPSIRKKVES
ncbi:NAD(P)/FAD-dependent oxidoreductase [Caldisphaera sp.]|uniref:NAD(P)/FAD-dependent oxidoreductase n=1 Tax=Caldisphaera sp. TaxID=2060322 RepID=UPI0039795937